MGEKCTFESIGKFQDELLGICKKSGVCMTMMEMKNIDPERVQLVVTFGFVLTDVE